MNEEQDKDLTLRTGSKKEARLFIADMKKEGIIIAITCYSPTGKRLWTLPEGHEPIIDVNEMSSEECAKALFPSGSWGTIDFWIFLHWEFLWHLIH